ncbi:hypothetical protein DXA17_19650, partial [Ruminococcus sp. AM58-7XD]
TFKKVLDNQLKHLVPDKTCQTALELGNQLKHLVPDKTCQTALELGAIYRELTRFDDAMTVYEKIENTCNLSAYWNARLKLNTGIILKNRLG